MHYVISDIHGCYEQFEELLEKIHFSDADILYILGDVVDRGPHPMAVFLDIMERPNVIFLLGNHEYMFLLFVQEMGLDLQMEKTTADVRAYFRMWLREGGDTTYEEFLTLDYEKRQAIVDYMHDAFIYEELELEDKSYVLVHAGIAGYESEKELFEYEDVDLLEGRTDYSQPLLEDERILVTGHTPSFYIHEDGRPEIFIGNGHIAIDCGAAFHGKLAAYCFETKECFYV